MAARERKPRLSGALPARKPMQIESTQSLESRIDRLERRMRRERRAWIGAALGAACLACASFSRSPARSDETSSVLHVRGIVVEDELGRPRILLGAPVPQVSGRKRTDPATGLVVMGEDGADHIQLGHVGGPQMGGKVNPRQSPATGLMVNDARGDERGGFGVFANGQVGFGLDYPSQREAIVAAVLPDRGLAGIVLSADVESNPTRVMLLAGSDGTTVLKMSDTNGADRAVWSAKGTEAPVLQVFDARSAPVLDAFAKQKP